ncbi:hypothetical protein XELAEV_18007642mg [Xenopus laevis]|uniref:Immunoglobulin V-set domain-containing protein n=1 Tax=Xenopus laevis TaxID=8355 RepID=A0A974E2R6_XENLA|nr:hypothetical protein XELAEV_18007642mg [Xenopus laevis]
MSWAVLLLSLTSLCTYSNKHKGDGVPDRFSGSTDSLNNFIYLTIKRALEEDDVDYYCSIWDPPSSMMHSGVLLWGTKTKAQFFS